MYSLRVIDLIYFYVGSFEDSVQPAECIYLDIVVPKEPWYVCVCFTESSRHTGQSWWQALGGQPALDSGSSSPLGPHFNSKHFTGQWAEIYSMHSHTIWNSFFNKKKKLVMLFSNNALNWSKVAVWTFHHLVSICNYFMFW